MREDTKRKEKEGERGGKEKKRHQIKISTFSIFLTL